MTSEPCPLCKSERVGVKYHLTGYRIAECLDCGLEYHDNFQGGGDTDEMFSEDYYRNVQHEAFSNQFTDYAQDASAKVYERWLSEMAKRVTPGRILDVGSARSLVARQFRVMAMVSAQGQYASFIQHLFACYWVIALHL